MSAENHRPIDTARANTASTSNSAPDLNRAGWLRHWPETLQNLALLARWDRPVGIWLLFWPAFWGLLLAHHGAPPLSLIIIFALGAMVMRGAGCTVNDLLDRRFDAKVSRTATRPLAAGRISVRAAWLWLAAQLAVASALLLLLPAATWPWALAAMPLVLLYPLMKRITWWPQVWLGLTFNWGLWLGFATAGATATAAPATMPMLLPFALCYLGAVFWTVGYDTLYAMQDMADDALIGVRSSARRLGQHTALAVGLFYLAALGAWLLAGNSAALGPAALLGYTVAAVLLWRQWHGFSHNRLTARAAFLQNIWVGAAIAMALALGYAF